MSRYVKKHKWQIMGVAAPLFAVFFLVAIGLSVNPNWINKTYGTPGASCNPLNSSDTTCNVCNLETCDATSSICVDLCGNSTLPATPCPACPNFDGFPVFSIFPKPGCWTACQENTFTPVPGVTLEFAECSPVDSFCQDISGGTLPNACRSASCTPIATPDPNNPSGCDYELIDPPPSTACLNCSEPLPAGFDFCGNGICEKAHGEDCDQCPEDCLLPGFTDACPLTSGSTIEDACDNPGPRITFSSGPPFNVPNSQECEDGDLCTDNACPLPNGLATCTVIDKVCDLIADFCCPDGCTPSNDPDCLEPVDCGVCGDNIINGTDECDGSNAGCPEGHVCDVENCKCVAVPSPFFIHGDGCASSLHPTATLTFGQSLGNFFVLGLEVVSLWLFRRKIR